MEDNREPAPDNTLAESAKSWGQFAAAYQAFMLQAWEEAITAQPRIQEAVADALTSWNLPTRAEQEETIQALESLTTRLQELTTKMQALEKWIADRVQRSVSNR